MRTRYLGIIAGALFAVLPFTTAQALPDTGGSDLPNMSHYTPGCVGLTTDGIEARSSCNRNTQGLVDKPTKPPKHDKYCKWHKHKKKDWKKHKKWDKKWKKHKKDKKWGKKWSKKGKHFGKP